MFVLYLNKAQVTLINFFKSELDFKPLKFQAYAQNLAKLSTAT